MTATIIDGAEIAQQVRTEVAALVRELQRRDGVAPGLVLASLVKSHIHGKFTRTSMLACYRRPGKG